MRGLTSRKRWPVPLFYRRRKPLQLTPAGRQLLQLAQRVLPDVERVEQSLKHLASGRAGRLHITIECHACFEWLLPLLDRYRKVCPAVEVDIRLGMSFDPIPPLLRGDIDLVISSDPVDTEDVVFADLFHYEAQLVVAHDHPLATRPHIEPADLAQQTLLTYPVERKRLDVFTRFLEPAGVEPAALRQVELTAMILQLVAAGRGVAVLPDWVLESAPAADNITPLPLGRDGMRGTLYAAVRRSDRKAHYIRRFIDMARELGARKAD